MTQAKKTSWLLKILLPTLYAYFCSNLIELSVSQELKTWGEDCDADCDERQLLTCSQNTSVCECIIPNAMVYSKDSKKCVSKAGQPCVRYGKDSSCVSHASCERTSTTCVCDKGYFQTDNGTCYLMAKYGDQCSPTKRPCDHSSGMVCSDKPTGTTSSGRQKRTCECMYPSDQYYNATAKSCISYPGGNCSFSGACVRNAECSVDIYELRRGENIHGKVYSYNVTVGRKCACLDGFTQTTETRECLPTYRQPCDVNSPSKRFCNGEENLNCFDSSICLCKSPLSQIYDWDLAKCTLLVGAVCSQGGGGGDDKSADDVHCTSNAECNSVTGKCECKGPNFSSTPSFTCLKSFGMDCREGECNMFRGLSCHQQSGTCGCIDDTLKYDTNTRTCLSEPGGPCGTFEHSEGIGVVRGNIGGDGGARTMTGMMGSHGRGTSNAHVAVFSRYNGSSSVLPLSNVTTSIRSGNPKKNASLMRTKIRIKCGHELECVNEFGEKERGCESSTFQGFCQ